MIYAAEKINVPRGKPLPNYIKIWIWNTWVKNGQSIPKTATLTRFSFNTVKKVVNESYKHFNGARWEGKSFINDIETREFVRSITLLYPYQTNFELSVLYEQVTLVPISVSTIRRIRADLQLTYKKFTDYNINRNSPRIIEDRRIVREAARAIPSNLFVYIDETHVNTENSYQLRGYAPVGEVLNRDVDNLKNKSRSIIGAINQHGIILTHNVNTVNTGVKWV
jgi:transposase